MGAIRSTVIRDTGKGGAVKLHDSFASPLRHLDRPVRVIVVGAGVGGLAAALALHARGIRPLVLEREPALERAGAGLQLGPNAVRVLFALGLETQLRAIGSTPLEAQVRRGRDGRRLMTTPFGDAEERWGAPYLQAPRAALQALLHEAVERRDAAEVRLAAPVDAADPAGGVKLQDGTRFAADLVIGADGLRSSVAAALPEGAGPRPLGQSAWRALIPADRLPAHLLAPVTQVRIGRGGHLVTYPLAGGRVLNLVAVAEEPAAAEEGWAGAGDPAVLRRVFADWAEPAPTLLAALEAGALWRGGLYARTPRRRWFDGRLVLLGDAAHPMSPSFAQGAGMAIEDAWTLAEALSRHAPDDALAAYWSARIGRTARVQAQSEANARLFHLPDALSSPLFAAAGLAGRLDGSRGLARFDWLYGGGPIPSPA